MQGAIDWSRIRLVAFDVDGTLYAQRPLRLRMAAALAAHSILNRDRRTFAVLRSYRDVREAVGDAETEDFETALLTEVSRRHGVAVDWVAELVSEWMVRRPLPSLRGCRYKGVDTLFDRIRRSGRAIGVLSDYPAQKKLEAMGLRADHVVSADEVGVLKPHPRGLETLMRMAGAAPEETILVGDRVERDGEAARRAGAASLIRTSKPVEGWRCFARFDDPVFDGVDTPLLQTAAA